MAKRWFVSVALLAVFSVVLAACGDDATTAEEGLSDEEFAAEASSICDTLAADLDAASVGRDSFGSDAGPAYRSAAAAMRALDFTEGSAPLATDLVTYLDEVADGRDEFDGAVAEAIAESDFSVGMLFIGEDGKVRLYSADGDEMVDAGIDRGLYRAVIAAEAAVGEAAGSLGLTGCVPPFG